VTGDDLGPLDGPIAAPDHHRVLFENDAIRVLETRIAPGDSTPLHTHLRRTILYVVSGTDFVRRDADGVVLLDTRDDPDYGMFGVIDAPPVDRHTLENVGPDPIVVVGIELKTPDVPSTAP
jgi:mannose-6-phosphate isomerase-like protein (cupin superfamily)